MRTTCSRNLPKAENQRQEFKRQLENPESMAGEIVAFANIGADIPLLIIRLSRLLSGREPEFALAGEELRVRLWTKKE
ncbi:MAG: hypothetical protein KDJ28_16285 [Candidatus Competibacteraceae bacterium]|nr:hypothetical protein [Candidatus Competibacteraceae bacterium]